MNQQLLNEARNLVERANAGGGKSGVLADTAQMETLRENLGGRLPRWYIELLTTVPLCYLEMGWQALEPTRDDDGVNWVEWLGPRDIESESLESYPGKPILERGYICVGGCSHGSGDQYFLAVEEGDDPPLYQIDHESGSDADTILSEGRERVSSSLSEFFRMATIER